MAATNVFQPQKLLLSDILSQPPLDFLLEHGYRNATMEVAEGMLVAKSTATE